MVGLLLKCSGAGANCVHGVQNHKYCSYIVYPRCLGGGVHNVWGLVQALLYLSSNHGWLTDEDSVSEIAQYDPCSVFQCWFLFQRN